MIKQPLTEWFHWYTFFLCDSQGSSDSGEAAVQFTAEQQRAFHPWAFHRGNLQVHGVSQDFQG